jgi:hypothetical protein
MEFVFVETMDDVLKFALKKNNNRKHQPAVKNQRHKSKKAN